MECIERQIPAARAPGAVRRVPPWGMRSSLARALFRFLFGPVGTAAVMVLAGAGLTLALHEIAGVPLVSNLYFSLGLTLLVQSALEVLGARGEKPA